MKSMKIYIPTRGRIASQKTWDRIPESLKPQTLLVCPPSEVNEHRSRDRNVLSCSVEGIAATRQWLVERTLASKSTKLCMTDDDHYFFRRENPSSPRLKVCIPSDIEEMFGRIELLLDKYPMVGVSARQGNDAFLALRYGSKYAYELEPGLCLNKKTCNLYGVRADILDKEKIRFDATPLMEDMHVSLSLIALGYDTALISEWVWNQPGSGAAGGCSLYRDLELQKDSARKLASLHKPFVSIIKKRSISPDGWKQSLGEWRIDVRVDWTGAVQSARAAARPRLF